MKKTIIFFLFFGLVVVSYLIYLSVNKLSSDFVKDQAGGPSTNSSIKIDDIGKSGSLDQKQNIPGDWKTLTNKDYTIQYPSEATSEVRGEESLVHFMGQKQIDSGRTQTELFDGYSFRVGKITDASTSDLKQLALSEKTNAENNCNYEDGNVSDLSPIRVGGQGGFQYSAKGCYIDYTETIVGFDGNFYRVSQSYVGDGEDYDYYKNITNMIFSTLEFHN